MKHPYAPESPYVSGQTVTAGRFECTSCGWLHEVADGRVANLPVCPVCQNEFWANGARKRLFG